MAFSSSLSASVLISMVVILASAETSYNSKTQVCCNGTVSDKSDSRDVFCCGSTPYDYQTSLCCFTDQVLESPTADVASYGCCYDPATQTSTIYNYHWQECCDGKALDKPNSTLCYSCCNGELFHWSTHMCCNGGIQERDDEEACCGGQEVYNWKSHICCEKYGYQVDGKHGVVEYTLSEGDSSTSTCCDLQVYDQTKEACCNGVVKPKKGDIGRVTWGQCCGGEPYDSRTKACCSKWGEIAHQEYGVTEFKLHNTEEGDSPFCCGLELFDYREQICCNQSTVIAKPAGCNKENWMGCCGGQAITDHSTELCHNDKIYQREDTNFYVCGDKLYDLRVQECCGDQIYDIDSTLECCYGAQEVYDRTTQKCCFDEVKLLTDEDRAADHDACCAVEYYYHMTC